jgi:vesicle transport protein SEC22
MRKWSSGASTVTRSLKPALKPGHIHYSMTTSVSCVSCDPSPLLLPFLSVFALTRLVLAPCSSPNSYQISDSVCFLCICDRSYPRKLAFTYLSDLATEFTTTYSSSAYLAPTCRPYAFVEFDTFIQRTKKTYQDSRASQNLDKLNDELRDVTKVMTKNIEDLLYRGDSLERMGEMSGRLREDSKKYRKAAVRINWELLLKQYGPVGALGLIILVFIWWRFL